MYPRVAVDVYEKQVDEQKEMVKLPHKRVRPLKHFVRSTLPPSKSIIDDGQ